MSCCLNGINKCYNFNVMNVTEIFGDNLHLLNMRTHLSRMSASHPKPAYINKRISVECVMVKRLYNCVSLSMYISTVSFPLMTEKALIIQWYMHAISLEWICNCVCVYHRRCIDLFVYEFYLLRKFGKLCSMPFNACQCQLPRSVHGCQHIPNNHLKSFLLLSNDLTG